MDADAERVRAAVREAARMGTRRFLFTGNGEPLMHPDAVELMALGKGAGSFCALNTNGHLLDRDVCDALVAMGFDELRVNALAGTRRTYGQTHSGVAEAGFDRLKDNLLYLAGLKKGAGTRRPRVALVQVVIGANHDGLLDFARFAAEVGAEEVQYRPFFDTGDPRLSRLTPTEQQADHVRASLPEAKTYLDSRGIAENTRYFAWVFGRQLDTTALYQAIPCYYGWLMSRLDVDGNVYFCCRCYDPLGNVEDRSFREIWLGEGYRRARARAVTVHRRGSPVEGCDCYSCVHHTANFRAYRALHPIRGREARLERLVCARPGQRHGAA
jgi:MoaA/NifB/PqqE/SkfB family radical SAM enzyme